MPYFDKKSVKAVVTALMTGGEGGEELPGRRVLINPREMKPNPAIPKRSGRSCFLCLRRRLPKAAGPAGQATDRAGT